VVAAAFLLVLHMSAADLGESPGLHRIVVSSDQWHSAVAIPTGSGTFEEWGYASRIWYFEHSRGLVPLVKTLLWFDGPGVIERVQDGQVLYQRSTQQPAYGWEFDVTQEQLDALRTFIHQSFENQLERWDGARSFYPAVRPYHVFHTCHHWLAHALRRAGIPVRAWVCMLPEGLWLELDRVSARPRIVGKAP